MFPCFEWKVLTVDSREMLEINLNKLEKEGWEIFSVYLSGKSKHTIVVRKEK